MDNPVDLDDIKNITVSGRIGSGSTTLATKLADILGWDILDGGKILRKINQEIGANVFEASKRPDHFDIAYEERIKKMLQEESSHVIQSHLAGFDAQNIPGIFKILVVCEDAKGEDKVDIRIDRLINRDKKSIEEAKHEILERDKQDLAKWRKLYAHNDQKWVYWNKDYYDLVLNTYRHNPDESLKLTLAAIGYNK